MKLSLNWLKEYITITETPAELEEILTAIGLEVEGMDETMSGPDLTGVVVGEVLTCGQHPDADRLRVTTVNVGAEEPLHIVCGAPNVAKGQKVLVATIGTVLPTEEGEKEFKIKKGKIRGQVSEGMICAEDELGIGTSHDGIMVLPEDTKVGLSAEEYLNFERDVVYDIGLTPNRSDATSHLGVAKDLSAYYKVNKQDNVPALKMPSIDKFQEGAAAPYAVELKDISKCPRYAGILLDGIKIKTSPEWMQNRLMSIGVRPISNIVDITNFILHELGQPLHAFDADKVKGDKVIVQTVAQDTPFITLDDKEVKLHSDDLMICNGEGEGMCIAGVFGGKESGVTDATSSIFLESAHFEAGGIRRTSFRHLLRTDAAMIFEKGSDPSHVVFALKRAVQLMVEYADAKVVSKIVDEYPVEIPKAKITLNLDKARTLIGGEISNEEIVYILESMDMGLTKTGENEYEVEVPSNKADVTRDVDLVEEILRIYGFNKVALPGYIQAAIQNSTGVDSFKVKNTIANMLCGAGFSEMMGLSLVDQKWLEEDDSHVTINNTSNITLNIMRPNMACTAMEAVLYNQNRKQANLRFFENGRAYAQNEKGFQETDCLSLTMTGDFHSESWMSKDAKVNFFHLKSYVHMILDKLGINSFQIADLKDDWFEGGLMYHRGPMEIVKFGQVSIDKQEKYGIKNEVFHAAFNWDSIFKFLNKSNISVKEISKYPSMKRDLALVIDESIKFSEILAIAYKTDKKLLKEVNLFDVYKNDEQLGKGKKSYAISYLFENIERTLKDKEVNKIMDNLIRSYETKLGAVIRK